MIARARVGLLQAIERVRSSYWFVPMLLAFSGFTAGLLLVVVDSRLGDDWLGRFEWFYGSRPDGARALLATVAGSMITVAGVVFSITLAAVTYASGQYGPRLLTYFVRDRGNQATLGAFIGTFLYCIVVLRTVRSAEETSADTGGAVREAFVPHVAMFGAMALAVVSIGVLIYFVHHVTDVIHINNVIARIGRGLLDRINGRGDTGGDLVAPEVAVAQVHEPARLLSTRTGYIESIDVPELVQQASKAGVVLRIAVRPGDFVRRGDVLMRGGPMIVPELSACEHLFAINRRRSDLESLTHSIDELVEIAVRALSPGISDPFTAIACMDWLQAALYELGNLPPEPSAFADADGVVRVRVEVMTMEDYLQRSMGRLRPYVMGDLIAGAHLLSTLKRLRQGAYLPARRALLDADIAQLEQAQARLGATCDDCTPLLQPDARP